MDTNVLYFGDNLDVLRRHIPDESVDLIYLDPPFNSSRNYNVLFKETSGKGSDAQIEAFGDTWHWGPQAQLAYEELQRGAHQPAARMLKAMVDGLGHNDVTAYLSMMAIRLVELQRVLKSTGSLYLHCDPTASHYLKVLMDSIFGAKRFMNEIAWKRTSAHSDTKQGMKRYGKIHDVLLVYQKSQVNKWNAVYTTYADQYVASEYRHISHDGRRYKETDLTAAKPGGDTLYEWHVSRPVQKGSRWEADLGDEYLSPQQDREYKAVVPYKGRYWAYSKRHLIEFAQRGELMHRETGMPRLMQFADSMPGTVLQDMWDDIAPVSGGEDLGYNTQKPLALLERIVNASSNPGDTVLDPFCGCGTAVHASQKLGRKWIGIDITHLAIGLIRRRMEDAFPGLNVEVIGEPVDIGGARELAARDKYQFQWWALDKIGAQPVAGKKKGADKGIDGVIPYVDAAPSEFKRVIVSVKGGEQAGVLAVRDLIGVMKREDEPIGVLVTLNKPTKDMQVEATTAGHYENELWKKSYPRVQILTVEDILAGKRPEMPPQHSPFAKAQVERERAEEPRLL